MDEKQLLTAIKDGNSEAFDLIFKKYASVLYYFSLDMLENETDAEEIVQETFVKVWENRHKINPDQTFSTYLTSIAKNKIYNVIKHKLIVQKHSKGVSAYIYELPEEEKLAWEGIFQLMISAIEQLPDRQKEILTLRIQGCSNTEIAERLGISLRTVETHYSKGLATLRSMLNTDNNLPAVMLLLCLFS